jgi:CRP/FNR family transcriptional regulator
VVNRNPRFALELLKHINEMGIKNFEKIINLTQKQMHGRVADTLLYLSKMVYNTNVFHTTLSRQELAELSAMTKESVIRIIKEFKDEKILQVEGNKFYILQEETLLNISRKG